ncbi:MICOS complex subunit MIC19 [Wickerhamiella sorbophila]|uniref:MICOS complex subunit MIC19 n=1 Tax=Wickerhamiella sorbophila TaxID=45607 RepID=A0A2T0FEG9_9ASCO|nr:MICOS complex subunit MIC19 [Wickerhamiella sorbophila]PRT53396.1 MICOS complex subunit MIC19 [Wickerhamiella sorbophila]
MGQTTSKENNSKVFQPQTPVEVSGRLSNSIQSNPETDFTRNQRTNKYIEDKVAERMYQARIDAEAELEQAKQKIKEIDEGRIAKTDSKKIKDQLEKLHNELSSRPKKGALNKASETARAKLIECFEKNKNRPLNCRAEYDDFHAQVKRMEEILEL